MKDNRGRKPKHQGKVLFTRVDENPYRPGSRRHKAFSLVFENVGITWEEFNLKGGSSQDLNRAVKDGYIEVENEGREAE